MARQSSSDFQRTEKGFRADAPAPAIAGELAMSVAELKI